MTRVLPRSDASEPNVAGALTLGPGTRLGRYVLLAQIAEGGMAQVWAAEQAGDLGFRKLIALKTIRPDYAHNTLFRAMFLDEAQLASRIRHANVVEVLDLGVEGNVVYQAMALIEGTSLSEWSRAFKLPVGVGTRIAIDILRGLHAAHELCDDDGEPLGLVHRDVSPQNVLVGADGVAKLADFGIAKALGRATEETTAGDVKGKLTYVAPEQLDGLPAGRESDLFSAGVVLWEVLTGSRLFPLIVGATPEDRAAMKVRDPRSVAPEIPDAVADIVMHALREKPLERYASSLEMADALEEAIRHERLDATHRDVATRLEEDRGEEIRERREALRRAKKRAATAPQPAPAPPVEDDGIDADTLEDSRAAPALPVEDDGIDADTLEAETVDAPRRAMLPHAATPMTATTTAKTRRSGGQVLPLAVAAAALLLAIVIGASTMRRKRTVAAAPPTPIAPVVMTALPEAMPLPTVVIVPAADSAPTAVTPPSRTVTHGRARPATKPTVSAAPSATPRFEKNPY